MNNLQAAFIAGFIKAALDPIPEEVVNATLPLTKRFEGWLGAKGKPGLPYYGPTLTGGVENWMTGPGGIRLQSTPESINSGEEAKYKQMLGDKFDFAGYMQGKQQMTDPQITEVVKNQYTNDWNTKLLPKIPGATNLPPEGLGKVMDAIHWGMLPSQSSQTASNINAGNWEAAANTYTNAKAFREGGKQTKQRITELADVFRNQAARTAGLSPSTNAPAPQATPRPAPRASQAIDNQRPVPNRANSPSPATLPTIRPPASIVPATTKPTPSSNPIPRLQSNGVRSMVPERARQVNRPR